MIDYSRCARCGRAWNGHDEPRCPQCQRLRDISLWHPLAKLHLIPHVDEEMREYLISDLDKEER